MRSHFLSIIAVVLALFVMPLSGESEVGTKDEELRVENKSLQVRSPTVHALHFFNLFADHRAANVGDIVTVIIAESSSASKSASTQTSRISSKEGEITDLAGISSFGGIGKFFPLKSGMNSDSGYTGSGSTSRSGSLATKISAKVTQVLPNGNLLIEGRRDILLNEEKESITISGVARPEDVSAGNIILSTKLADVQINYEGEGIITKQQRPGILSRILSWLWIF